MRHLLVVALLAAGCSKPQPTKQAPAPVAYKARPAIFVAPDETPGANKNVDRSPVSALTGKIRVPADGGAWPEAFPPAPPPVEGKAVPMAVELGVHAMVVSPESGRFVVCQKLGRPVDAGTENGTRFVLGDVTAGKVLAEWETAGEFDPLDLSPDGTRFVARSGARLDNTLTLFTVSPDLKLARRTAVVHDFAVQNPAEAAGKEKDLVVRWAGFVGNDRVASAAAGGQVRVFDVAALTRVGTLDGTPGVSPCVTPDRKKLVAHADGKAVLIEPAQCQAVATKAWQLPSGPVNLAVSPDGTTVAAATPGRVRFLAVKTGEYRDQLIPRFADDGMPPRNFSWCGPAYLVHNRKVYDPTVSYPVWLLSHPSAADGYSSRQVWAAARVSGDPAASGPPVRVAVRAFDALPPDLPDLVADGKTWPGIYLLPPGAAVRVDASRLATDKQTAARADLEQRLRAAGYVVSGTAESVFALSVDPPTKKTTTYKNVPNTSYGYQPLRVQLRNGDKALGDFTLVKTPPAKLEPAGNEPLAKRAAAEGWGLPDYAALKTVPIPPHYPGPGFPRQGFGATALTPEGPVHFGRR